MDSKQIKFDKETVLIQKNNTGPYGLSARRHSQLKPNLIPNEKSSRIESSQSIIQSIDLSICVRLLETYHPPNELNSVISRMGFQCRPVMLFSTQLTILKVVDKHYPLESACMSFLNYEVSSLIPNAIVVTIKSIST